MKKLLLVVLVVFCFHVKGQSRIITTIAGNGTQGYSGDNAAATSAALAGPAGIFVDDSGNVFIADWGNNRIRKVNNSTGIITTVAGNGTLGYSGDSAAATNAELNNPGGVSVDAFGNVFIADYYNHRIRKVNGSTGIITTIAGNGTMGYSGDGSLATSAELRNPFGVSVDALGNVFIADDGNSRIRKVNSSTGIITTIAGNGVYGYGGDGVAATSTGLSSPTGVSVDVLGNVFIADAANNRIRKVNCSTGIITTVAGNGTQGYGGDGSAATSAALYYPQGVFVDAAGNLFIAEYFNHRIRKVNGSTGIITTIAGNGTADYAGDGAAATSAELNYPSGVFADVLGNVFIADYGNNRVRMVMSGATANSPTICIGTTATLTANGGTTYTWFPATGLSATTGSMVVASPSVTTIYTVTGTTGGSNVTTIFTVNINPLPIVTSIAINPACSSCCGGSGGSVKVTASGTGPFSFNWFDLNNTSYSLSDSSSIISGLWNTVADSVQVTDASGCSVTEQYILTTPQTMSVAIGPLDSVFCIGNSYIITYTISGGTPPYNISWNPMPDIGGESITSVTILQNDQNELYDYVLQDANGCMAPYQAVWVNTQDCSASINQLSSNNNQIEIYPNPNQGSFVVETNETEKQRITLYDINGQLVLNQIIQGKTNIDASHLADGIYNISIITKASVVNRRLIIVK